MQNYYSKSLWEVNDRFLNRPEDKFYRLSSPLVEATLEQWGCGQLENASVPEEMVTFVTAFVRMLGLAPSEFSTVKDVCHSTMVRLEFDEPYFFMVDMLIQLSHNGLTNTFRHRQTGAVLDPCKLETFKIDRSWDFKPYHMVKNMMEHPGMKMFLEKNIIPRQFCDREQALESLLKKISEAVWGDYVWFGKFVDQALAEHEEGLLYHEGSSHILVEDTFGRHHPATGDWGRERAASSLMRDRLFWIAASLGVMTWFKGPAAIPFLSDYHVIYAQLIDYADGKSFPIPGTGDEVIVDGQDIYTHKQLEFIPNRPPDTCVSCGVVTHCSKFVNVTALEHKICSCGGEVDPLDDNGLYNKHHQSRCVPYREAHPERTGYVCQRCIFKIVNRLSQDVRCGRAVCPAIKCPHHMGVDARVRALTIARTHQLTGAASP